MARPADHLAATAKLNAVLAGQRKALNASVKLRDEKARRAERELITKMNAALASGQKLMTASGKSLDPKPLKKMIDAVKVTRKHQAMEARHRQNRSRQLSQGRSRAPRRGALPHIGFTAATDHLVAVSRRTIRQR